MEKLCTMKQRKSWSVNTGFYQPLMKNTLGGYQNFTQCKKTRDKEIKRNTDSKKLVKKPYVTANSYPPTDLGEATNMYPSVFDDGERLCEDRCEKRTKGGRPRRKKPTVSQLSLPEIVEEDHLDNHDIPFDCFDWKSVDKKDFDSLRYFLCHQDWAREYYDSDDGFHISVKGISEKEAKKKLEDENFTKIPIIFVEPMGGSFTFCVAVHVGDSLQALGGRGLYGGSIGSRPQKIYGICPAHLIEANDIEREINLTSRRKLDGINFVVSRKFVVKMKEVNSQKNEENDTRITADIALFNLEKDVLSDNRIDVNGSTEVPKGTYLPALYRGDIADIRKQRVAMRNQDGSCIFGTIQNVAFTQKDSNLYDIIVMVDDPQKEIAKYGDSGALVWIPRPESKEVDAIGFVLGQHCDRAGKHITIINNLPDVLRFCPLFAQDEVGFYDNHEDVNLMASSSISCSQAIAQTSNVNLQSLPTELVEQILFKAFLIVHYQKGMETSRPIRETYSQLASVCSNWRRLADNRGWFAGAFGDQLARNGDVQLTRSARLRTGLEEVRGVTEHNNCIYIICSKKPSTGTSRIFARAIISVYDSLTFDYKHDISFTETPFLSEIAACRTNNCLFVSEETNDAVWALSNKGKKIGLWIEGTKASQSSPVRLTVTSESHLLVLYCDKPELAIYDQHPDLIRRIKLPTYMEQPQNAMQLASGNFIVSYGGQTSLEHRVCEVHTTGAVIRYYEGTIGEGVGLLNCPVHFVMDSNSRIYVADLGNNRVLLFDSMLKKYKVLLNEADDRISMPSRLCHMIGTGRLLVAQATGNVDVYESISLRKKSLDPRKEYLGPFIVK